MDPPQVFRKKFLDIHFKKESEYTEEYIEKTKENIKEYNQVWEELSKKTNISITSTKYNYTFTGVDVHSNRLKELLEKQKKMYTFVMKFLK